MGESVQLGNENVTLEKLMQLTQANLQSILQIFPVTE